MVHPTPSYLTTLPSVPDEKSSSEKISRFDQLRKLFLSPEIYGRTSARCLDLNWWSEHKSSFTHLNTATIRDIASEVPVNFFKEMEISFPQALASVWHITKIPPNQRNEVFTKAIEITQRCPGLIASFAEIIRSIVRLPADERTQKIDNAIEQLNSELPTLREIAMKAHAMHPGIQRMALMEKRLIELLS